MQTLYLIGFALDPNDLSVLELVGGFSYAFLSFIPSVFIVPEGFLGGTTQAILKYGIDGSLIRNAGFSLMLAIIFIVILSIYFFISLIHSKFVNDSKLWRPQLLKQLSILCYLLVLLNMLVFSLFEMRFWSINNYKQVFASGLAISVLVLTVAIGLIILLAFKDRNLLCLQIQIIATSIVIVFAFSDYLACLLGVWACVAAGKLAVNWQKPIYDRLLIVF
jgi:hypothetical protein